MSSATLLTRDETWWMDLSDTADRLATEGAHRVQGLETASKRLRRGQGQRRSRLIERPSSCVSALICGPEGVRPWATCTRCARGHIRRE